MGDSRDVSHLVWKTMESETLHDARIFRVSTVRRQSPDGVIAPFVSVDAPNWVTVIPENIDSAGSSRFLTVRQYRHGTQKVGMEFPAGMIDLGEEPIQAAARELLEETGYEASEWVELGAVSPNPAFMTNTAFTFLARGVVEVAEQDLDQHEILDVHWVEYSDLAASMGRHPYDSAITVQAWYFYLVASGRLK